MIEAAQKSRSCLLPAYYYSAAWLVISLCKALRCLSWHAIIMMYVC